MSGGRRLFQHYPQTGHYVHNAICIHLSKSCVYYVCCLYAFLCFGFREMELGCDLIDCNSQQCVSKMAKMLKTTFKILSYGPTNRAITLYSFILCYFPAKAKKTSLSLNKSIATPFFSTNCAKYLRHTKARKNSSSLPLVARKSHTKC